MQSRDLAKSAWELDMRLLPIERYREYVAKHSSPTELMNLLHPRGEPFDDSYPNIYMANDPMPEWMRFSKISSLNDLDVNFSNLLQMYYLETKVHIDAISSRLRQIRERRTGLALLAEIKSTKWVVTILPFRERDINATASSRSDVRATAKGARVQAWYDPFEEEPDFSVGAGIGSNSIVRVTPSMFSGSNLRQPGNAPDEVLFHELVHASRQMRGVVKDIYVDRNYDNQEEYLAVVLSNIYLSEKGQLVLVGDHGVKPLQGTERDTFIYNSQHVAQLSPMGLMKNFKDSQQEFYNALAHLPQDQPPRWNPARQYEVISRDRERLRGHDTQIF